MHTRRDMLSSSVSVATLLATVGMLPAWAQAAYNRSAFDATNMAELMKALGAGSPTESKDVIVTGPDIFENGAVVPIGVATALPGVKRMLVLVEKNPMILSAMFDVTDAVEPSFSIRVKMAQSSNVVAVAMTNDGRVLFAKKEINVTLGGCGG